ncbi:MAG: type III-A CRISPR-associated RAMP protein Csm4 [Promethearchaeota archaeon]
MQGICKCLTFKQRSPLKGFIDSIKVHGAILSTMKSLFPEYFNNYLALLKTGKIAFSSPMPIINEKLIMFRPILPINIKNPNPAQIIITKKFKKLTHVPIDLLPEILSSECYDYKLIKKIINAMADIEKEVGMHAPWTSIHQELPAVTIERLTCQSTIYDKHVSFFKTNTFAILIKTPDNPEIYKKIKACFKLLADIGLSKSTSTGMGKLEISKENVNATKKIQDISAEFKDKFYTVSKYIPSPEDLNSMILDKSNYKLTTISGYKNDGRFLGILKAFTEGSVFNILNHELKEKIPGRIINVYDDHAMIGVPFYI